MIVLTNCPPEFLAWYPSTSYRRRLYSGARSPASSGTISISNMDISHIIRMLEMRRRLHSNNCWARIRFDDGDVLLVAQHRMKLLDGIGPTFRFGEGRSITMSISISGFDFWRNGRVLRDACAFWLSSLYERFMLVINNAVIRVTGRNYFFLNKPTVNCAH
jgi:hypothetical protein